MPSIQDVADQINAKLDSIQSNTAGANVKLDAIESNTASANVKLDQIDGDLQTGFTHLAGGLQAIWEAQKLTNSILEFQGQQNEAIICLLRDADELLCGITRKFTQQLDLTGKLLKSAKRVEGIEERTQPAAAADYDRLLTLQRELGECCPAEPVAPEPCPEGCEAQKVDLYKPKGQDWKAPIRQTKPG
ncbi:MAG: hypothetical protein ACR2GO_04340 [Candidatus Limnocylindria bacterium]